MTDRPPLAETLDLAPHPEGGWYRETWRSPIMTQTPYGTRHSATAIYFLLEPGESSAPHVVRSAELWLWHRGGPLTLTIGDDDVTLGPDVEKGHVPQAVVPAGAVQSARPQQDEGVLVSCVVSPGFDFADFALI